jgi:hypothetical protein
MWCIEAKAKIDILLGVNEQKDFFVVKSGDTITVTKGRNEKYALWHHTGIWDLPKEYVGETLRVISNS